MKGANMWDTIARYETSLSLHTGCGLGPHASSAPLVRGTSGVEYMDVSGRGLDVAASRGVPREEWNYSAAGVELKG